MLGQCDQWRVQNAMRIGIIGAGKVGGEANQQEKTQ